MRRKELMQLKRINATPKMVNMARNNAIYPVEAGEDWYKRTFTTRYDMMMRCQTRGRYLMVCLFFPEQVAQGKTTPLYEIYLNRDGNEWETRIRPGGQENESWSSAKICNLGRVYSETLISEHYAYTKKFIDGRIWINKEGYRTIKDFLKTKEGGWGGILEFQERAREVQIREKEEREQKPWDEDMALVPEELEGFKKWSVHEMCPDTFIFYDYDRKGAKEGYCSYCRKMVPVIKPRNNKETRCSSCRRKAVFKLNTYINTVQTERWNTECIQAVKGGYVIREFKNHISYRKRTKENPDISHWETNRTLVTSGNVKKYEYGDYKGKKMRWIRDRAPYYGCHKKSGIYKRNMAGLKRGALKRSTVFDWKELPCKVSIYLELEVKYPIIEQLVKIGMMKAAEEFINAYGREKLYDQKKTDIAGMLRIDKSRLKRLKAMDGGFDELKWMQAEKRADTIWPDEMIKDFGRAGLELSSFGFLTPPLRFRKIWNYLRKQSRLSGETIGQTLYTWRDYYNMAEQEKWNVENTQIGWPKDLQEAHTEVLMAVKGESIKKQAKKLEEKWTKVNDILPETKKFEYKKGKYQIIAATCIEDMVREGMALSHCMDHADFYYDRIQKFEAYPFFLRKTSCPDKPWYTLEVESSGNIRQKRTTGDNQNKDLDDAIPFLKEWQKVFRSRMTPEEIEHGILANKKRIKEYEELRKNGNKIWHGKLAGKLLVDVLEADFMEAM